MFELYQRGYTTLFEQLISCIISVRTLHETTIPVSEKLFKIARTPKEISQLTPKKLEEVLHSVTFRGKKLTPSSVFPKQPFINSMASCLRILKSLSH